MPPYIRRPTIRLAYWIGMRRWACSISAMNPISTTAMINTMLNVSAPLSS